MGGTSTDRSAADHPAGRCPAPFRWALAAAPGGLIPLGEMQSAVAYGARSKDVGHRVGFLAVSFPARLPGRVVRIQQDSRANPSGRSSAASTTPSPVSFSRGERNGSGARAVRAPDRGTRPDAGRLPRCVAGGSGHAVVGWGEPADHRIAGIAYLITECLMVLLDSPPHTIEVFPQESLVDSYGNAIDRPSMQSVIVRCFVSRPRSTIDNEQVGRRMTNTYHVIGRTAPIGPWSRVIYSNESYSVENLQFNNASEGTSHFSCTIRREQ